MAELYQRYTHLVYGVCLKYLRNSEDSKDAVMNIFEKLIVDLHKHEIQNFKSWLHVTTKNHCLMKLRTDKRKPMDANFNGASVMEYALPLHHDEDERSIDGDLDRMEMCIKGLVPNQEQCVRLFYLQEKSYRQISEQLNEDLKKVKSYIQNGKRNIKICLEQHAH